MKGAEIGGPLVELHKEYADAVASLGDRPIEVVQLRCGCIGKDRRDCRWLFAALYKTKAGLFLVDAQPLVYAATPAEPMLATDDARLKFIWTVDPISAVGDHFRLWCRFHRGEFLAVSGTELRQAAGAQKPVEMLIPPQRPTAK